LRSRCQGERGVERFARQRPQQFTLEGPVVPDTHRSVADAPPVIGVVPFFDQRVELVDRDHHRHRDAVVAAEPAALTLDAALLVTALMSGQAVEGVEAVGRAERVAHIGASLRAIPTTFEACRYDRGQAIGNGRQRRGKSLAARPGRKKSSGSSSPLEASM